jgi:hypothetical protein
MERRKFTCLRLFQKQMFTTELGFELGLGRSRRGCEALKQLGRARWSGRGGRSYERLVQRCRQSARRVHVGRPVGDRAAVASVPKSERVVLHGRCAGSRPKGGKRNASRLFIRHLATHIR